MCADAGAGEDTRQCACAAAPQDGQAARADAAAAAAVTAAAVLRGIKATTSIADPASEPIPSWSDFHSHGVSR